MVRIIREEVCEVVIWYVEKQHKGSGKALNFVDAVSGRARCPKQKRREVLLIAKLLHLHVNVREPMDR